MEPGVRFGRRTGTTGTPSELVVCLGALGENLLPNTSLYPIESVRDPLTGAGPDTETQGSGPEPNRIFESPDS